MSANEPMTQEQLDAIKGRLDCGTPTTEDVSNLLAEVERLRALTTVDEDMVERAAAVRFKREFLQRNSMVSNDYASHRLEQIRRGTPTAWRQYTQDIRAELDAALGTGEEA